MIYVQSYMREVAQRPPRNEEEDYPQRWISEEDR